MEEATTHPTRDTRYVYIVFSLHIDGMVSVRAICSTSDIAIARVASLKGSAECQGGNSVEKAWYERCELDHLLVSGMFELSVYGSRIKWEDWPRKPEREVKHGRTDYKQEKYCD